MPRPVPSEKPLIAAPSFADLVEKVRPAVVSVKVKIETASMTDDEMSDGARRTAACRMSAELSPDDPLYRFFQRSAA